MSWAADNRYWLEPYIQEIADRMGLRDWQIKLEDNDPSGGTLGECEAHQGAKRAWIAIADHGDDEEDLRNTVIHELLHCHWNEANKLVEELATNFLGMAASAVTRIAWKSAMELGIDGIATAWESSMPLPSEWLEQQTAPEEEAA